MQGFAAVFTVVRLLTPLKLSYEAAKKRAEPYTKIVGELPEMRRDTVELVRKAIAQDQRAYVLVNNRVRRKCAVDGAGTLRDATQLGTAGPQTHRRLCSYRRLLDGRGHSIPIPGSDAHTVFDPLAVSIALVKQPLESAS